jgi:hypothetical protein
MMHIILGLFFVALGIWGIFDEWYYVLDCLKGGGALLLLLGGLLAILAGCFGRLDERAAGAPATTAEEEP